MCRKLRALFFVQGADVPFRDLPKAFTGPIMHFISHVEASTAADFQLQLLDAALGEISTSGSKKGPQVSQQLQRFCYVKFVHRLHLCPAQPPPPLPHTADTSMQ